MNKQTDFEGTMHLLRRLEEEYLTHALEEARQPHPDGLPHLESADYHLDAFYFARKLRHFCIMLDYQKFSDLQVDINLPEGFLGRVKSSPCRKEPAVKAYFLAAQMLLNPKAGKHYRSLKSYLHDFGHRFEPAERRILYSLLKNYCIETKINRGKTAYNEELLFIYQTMAEEGLLLQNGQLDAQDYKNIVSVALRVGDFDWAEKFIQTYSDKLPIDNRDNIILYNSALLQFHQGNFEKVVEQLREVETENPTYALGGKLLLLKAYYELQDDLVLTPLRDSFRLYLKQSSSLEPRLKERYLNTLRFVEKLGALTPGDKKAAKKLRKKVKKTRQVAERSWILEKLDEAV